MLNGEVLWIITLIGGFGLILFLVMFFEEKRSKSMQVFAESLECSFIKKGPESFITRMEKFPLFTRGRSKRIRNLIEGQANGMNVKMLDYYFTVGSGRSSSTYSQTVLFFQSESLHIARFLIRPESVLDKVGSFFGGQDIDFDEFPQFSNMYVLQSEDEAACRSLFSEDLVRFFEANKGLCVQTAGDGFVLFCSKVKKSPKEMSAFLEKGFELCGLFRAAGDII